MCAGCQKENKCNDISWTDYNSVEDVHCHFKYYKEESKVYVGDTLKMYGWLTDSIKSGKYWYTLTAVKDLQFSHNGSAIYSNPFVSLFIPENINFQAYSKPYDSLLYVTGVVEYESLWDGLYLYLTNANDK